MLFPAVYLEAVQEIKNAFLGISNFRLARDGGYFSLANTDKIMLHTWYIALTVQFYLIAPFILRLLQKIFRQHLKTAMLVFTVVLILVAYKRCAAGNGYLLTQCRVWELFFGSCLYLYKDKFAELFLKNKFVKATLFYIGIVGTVISIFTVRLSFGEYYVSTSLFTVVFTGIVLLADYQNPFIEKSALNLLGNSLFLYTYGIGLYLCLFQNVALKKILKVSL